MRACPLQQQSPAAAPPLAPLPPARQQPAASLLPLGHGPVHQTSRHTDRAGAVHAAAGGSGSSPSDHPAAPAAAAQQQQQRQDDFQLLLTGVRVVLVAPKTPANIGAVLRVAENFEAHDVVVVDPRCDARCDEVAVTSCFSPLLDGGLRVLPSLADALADCAGSVGFTRRAGAGRVVHASLRQLLGRYPAAIPTLLAQPQQLGLLSAVAGDAAAAGGDVGAAAGGTVALVFGREESGLLESELLLCSHACSIPTGRSQPSMNLSHAVAVVLSQLFDIQQQRLMLLEERQADGDGSGGGDGSSRPAAGGDGGAGWLQDLDAAGLSGSLFEDKRVRWQREQALAGASQAELEALLLRAAALLEGAGISAKESMGGGDKSNHGRRKLLMGHIRSVLLRSQASTAEVRSLHGLCKELERRRQRQGTAGSKG